MSEKIKEIKNTPEHSIYQYGEGKDALTLTLFNIPAGKEYIYETEYGVQKSIDSECIELELSSNGTFLYHYSVDRTDAKNEDDSLSFMLSEYLYENDSKEASAIKKFFEKIDNNPLISEIKTNLKNIHQGRIEEEQEIERMYASIQEESAKREHAENALNKFVGESAKETITENKTTTEQQTLPENKTTTEQQALPENKTTTEQQTLPENKTTTEQQTLPENKTATNKLATLRKQIAHDMDETLGTHLEEKKLAKPVKKLEKAVSNKLFGHVRE